MRKSGQRGPSLYPKTAVQRAERIARSAGLVPACIEITTHKDGSRTIKVYGKRDDDGAADAELL
jgi:hypothetical protein